MPNHALSAVVKHRILIIAVLLVCSASLVAQESPFAAAMRTTSIQPVTASPFLQRTEPAERQHRFWDRQNRILFAAVGATSAADFCVTHANLAHGGRELNPVTRVLAGSTTGLAFNFAGETAGSIGLSYVFHTTGHHKLERIMSFVNIGGSAGAVAFGLAHR